MKYVILVSILLLSYFAYKELVDQDVAPLADDDLETVLKADTPEGRKLRSSFQQILPQVQGQDASSPAPVNDPNRVDIVSEPDNSMTVDDAVARVQNMLSNGEEEALTFARWTLFMSDFAPEQKEEFYSSMMGVLPKDQAQAISRDLLTRRTEPNLYRRALNNYTLGMDPAAQEELLRDLFSQTQEDSQKEVLNEFANSQGLSLRIN
jgi:hypothetical protein